MALLEQKPSTPLDVVVDAVDEAAAPERLVRDLLAPIARMAERAGVRDTRLPDSPDTSGSGCVSAIGAPEPTKAAPVRRTKRRRSTGHGHHTPSLARNIDRSVVPGNCARSAPRGHQWIIPTKPCSKQACAQAPEPGRSSRWMR